MVESAEAYQSILQPFYMSCPLSKLERTGHRAFVMPLEVLEVSACRAPC